MIKNLNVTSGVIAGKRKIDEDFSDKGIAIAPDNKNWKLIANPEKLS